MTIDKHIELQNVLYFIADYSPPDTSQREHILSRMLRLSQNEFIFSYNTLHIEIYGLKN